MKICTLQILEIVDDNTVYVKHRPQNEAAKATGSLWARSLYRRYEELNRITIVWRTIMEDECYPLDDNVLKMNHSGW